MSEKIWVARNGSEGMLAYVYSNFDDPPIKVVGEWINERRGNATDGHGLSLLDPVPKEVVLLPGEGPIRVSITATVEEE